MAATEAAAPFKVAKIQPSLVSKGKISESLGRLDILGLGVQVVSPDGGETNLHAHPGVDSAWVVLGGSATFYTVNDRVVAELDRYELIMIPAGAPYWFKANGDEPLVVLHITARAPGLKGQSRIDYEPYKEKARDVIAGAVFGR